MMPSSLHILAALAGTALAFPNPATRDSPLRILPYNWRFNITSLSGPGCPDYGAVSPPFVTRPTFGSNTVDGSEIYYWYFAYPQLRASVGPGTPKASVWCETTLSYEELDDHSAVSVEPGYRLKLHKNGTDVLASYDLEEGVEAKFRFTYFTSGKLDIVDTLSVAGPRAAGSYHDNTPVSRRVQWALPQCGSGTIKFRTELSLTATKKGAKGTVSSEQVQYEGKTGFYGLQQGVSYDWEKCSP